MQRPGLVGRRDVARAGRALRLEVVEQIPGNRARKATLKFQVSPDGTVSPAE